MIASLKGVVLEKGLTEVIVDVAGVGYRVGVSLIALAQLPDPGAPVQLRIRTVVREDAFELYGFRTRIEEELFLQLTSVSHVGPKMALNVMSGLEVEELCQAIAKGDVARLTKLHGVGKKTAERLVLELKDKVKLLATADGAKPAQAATSGQLDDVISALVNLGYKPPQAQTAADSASKQHGADAPFELLLREALKALRSSK